MSPSESPITNKPRDPRALNAYRHGLTGQVLIIPPDEKVAYQKHCESILQSLAPVGGLEKDVAQSVADDRWRLKRAAAMENNILAIGLTEPDQITAHHEQIDTALAMARIWLERSKELDRLTLYENRLQRRVEKNIALIRQMQQDRRIAFQQAAEEAAILGESYDFPRDTLLPQFDFSDPRIVRFADHHRRLADTRLRLVNPSQPHQKAA